MSAAEPSKARVNPWQQHVKATRKAYKEAGINVTYAQCLVLAKESYDKDQVIAGTSKVPEPQEELAEKAKERQRKKRQPARPEEPEDRAKVEGGPEERPATPPKRRSEKRSRGSEKKGDGSRKPAERRRRELSESDSEISDEEKVGRRRGEGRHERPSARRSGERERSSARSYGSSKRSRYRSEDSETSSDEEFYERRRESRSSKSRR